MGLVPGDGTSALLATAVPRRTTRLAAYDPCRIQEAARPLGPIGSIRGTVVASVTGTPTATTAKRAALPDVAAAQEDGPEASSAREITTRPTIVATLLDGVAVTEADGGEDAVPIPTTDGAGALVADGRPSPVALVVAGHAACPARQARAYATRRAVGEEATTGPEGMQDARTGLSSRRGLAADGPRPCSPTSAVPVPYERGALPTLVAKATSAGTVAAGTVPLAVRPLDAATASTGPLATNAVAEEGQLVALPHIAMALDRAYGVPTDEAIRDEVRLGGLDVGRRAASRQLRLGVQPQRGIAASINPRVLPTSDAFPGRSLGASPSADDGPRVDGQEAVGPRGAIT